MLEPDGSTPAAMPMPNSRPSRRASSRRCLQRLIVREAQQLVERRLVVAGIEHGAGGRLVGKGVARNEVAAAQLGRIDPEPARRDVHDPLEREIELRPAVAAVEPDRRAVGDDQLVLDRDVAHAIAAVRGRMHAIERGGLGRTDIGAHVRDVLEAQRRAARRRCAERGRDRSQPVARRRRCGQMLGAILDPLDGHAGQAADRREQHDVGRARPA